MNILSARKVQAKVNNTNKKMVNKGMSYRVRLGAMLACDNRKGQVMGKLQQEQDKAKAEQKHWPIEYCL